MNDSRTLRQNASSEPLGRFAAACAWPVHDLSAVPAAAAAAIVFRKPLLVGSIDPPGP
jgi:hypothetical protein